MLYGRSLYSYIIVKRFPFLVYKKWIGFKSINKNQCDKYFPNFMFLRIEPITYKIVYLETFRVIPEYYYKKSVSISVNII